MTRGDQTGINGWARFERRPWLVVLFVGVAVAFVNATSGIIEGAGDHWAEPVLWETTSAVIIIGLAPFVGRAVERWPPRADSIASSVFVHLGLTIPFALAHVAFIFLTRETAYFAFGGRYGFFDDGVAITLLYEWRKDVLVYAAIAATYWVFDHIVARREASPLKPVDDRIEIRDRAAAFYLEPSDISHIEAAGNYVEFHVAARTHLVRGTLAFWESKLAPRGFVRVHRSRLVNRAKIAAMRPTQSGDIEISLSTGSVVGGSRRYRAFLTDGAVA